MIKKNITAITAIINLRGGQSLQRVVGGGMAGLLPLPSGLRGRGAMFLFCTFLFLYQFSTCFGTASFIKPYLDPVYKCTGSQ